MILQSLVFLVKIVPFYAVNKNGACHVYHLLFFMLSSGLRKLEAFFGALITVMAISFGYEVSYSRFLPPLS